MCEYEEEREREGDISKQKVEIMNNAAVVPTYLPSYIKKLPQHF